MTMIRRGWQSVIMAGLALAWMSGATALAGAPKGIAVEIMVEGKAREALVFAPASAPASAPAPVPAPLVFVFHGHGSTVAGAAAKFDYQTLWPEAIVVYLQGLPTISHTDPAGAKAGWQHHPGDLEDRDLKFFDLALQQMRQDCRVDDRRIYATGQSNGGGFTYVLWAARGDRLAAVAPSSASIALEFLKDLKPKPALHIAGEKDTTAPYEKQQALMEAIRKLNGCEAAGSPWESKGVIYPSAGGTPLVEVIHPGGHPLPEWGPRLIVQFFKEQAKPE